MKNINHFMFAYFGNKRNEIINFYNLLDFNNITTIIEPYCGSSAMSYYISTQQPNKFKYIINDNNKQLIELYKLLKDDNLLNELEEKIKYYVESFNKIDNDEEKKNIIVI